MMAPTPTKKMTPKLTIPVTPVCRFREKAIREKIERVSSTLETCSVLMKLWFGDSATGSHSTKSSRNTSREMNATHEPNGLSLPYGARRLSSPKGGSPVLQASSARPATHRRIRIRKALAKNAGTGPNRMNATINTARIPYFCFWSKSDWSPSSESYSAVWNESSGARAEPRACVMATEPEFLDWVIGAVKLAIKSVSGSKASSSLPLNR